MKMKTREYLLFHINFFLLNYGLSLNFLEVCKLSFASILDCSEKQLSEVPHNFPIELYADIKEINLSNNLISSVDEFCFSKFINLEVIKLIGNKLDEEKVHKQAFSGLRKLRSLYFDNNNFKSIPNHFIFFKKSVGRLEMNGNKLTYINKMSLGSFSYLRKLGLQNNNIIVIEDGSFDNLRKTLIELDLRGNKLLYFPKTLLVLHNLHHLDIRDNYLQNLGRYQFSGMSSLKELHIFYEDGIYNNDGIYNKSLSMIKVDKNAFSNMPALQTLFLHYPNCILDEFPQLEGSYNISRLSIQNIKNLQIPLNFCDKMKQLNSIYVYNCTMENFPSLNKCFSLQIIDFVGNSIKHITNTAFSGLPLIERIEILEQNYGTLSINLNAFSELPSLKELEISDFELENFPNLKGTNSLELLSLKSCKIKSVPNDFCSNMKNLKIADFSGNIIGAIPSFSNCISLKALHLTNNQITSVGTQFQSVITLETINLNDNHISVIKEDAFKASRELKEIHLSHNLISNINDNIFEDIKSLGYIDLSFNNLLKIPSKGLKSLYSIKVSGNKGLIHFLKKEELPNTLQLDLVYPYHCCFFENKLQKHKTQMVSSTQNSVVEELQNHNNDTKLIFRDAVDLHPSMLIKPHCFPSPNDFYPCEDLFGKNWLRVCVWFVFLMAFFGNISVITVLLINFTRLDIPLYLVLNLALADLFLAIYVGFLAFVDVITLGDFRSHALEWQLSAKCNIAGFLATFSSKLSVFTLVVITIERFTTVKYSMYYEKRMTKRQTTVILLCGWVFSISLALLPLFQFDDIRFNDYTKYSVCLPFETKTLLSKGYVIFLISFDVVAFFVILFCYIKIYFYIQDSSAWNSRDSRATRRMALLVTADFTCWFPIALFAIISIIKKPYVSNLWFLKVLTVFVFPINACTNPFMYALLTKKFRKEMKIAMQKIKNYSPQYKKERALSTRMSGVFTSIGLPLSARRGSSFSFINSSRNSGRNDDLKIMTQGLKILQKETEYCSEN
uniref:Leucine-rich repeat-containing G-protein coupled receptor 4 n=1 Tax=Hydra vulgaris TaxID=6087 RepID=T2M5P3_HYDVU